MGYGAVKAAVALCQGVPVPAAVTTDFLVITKQNRHEPRIRALLAK